MPSPSSKQQASPAPDADLGARRYEYRYPTVSKAIAIGIVLLIPLAASAFIQLALRPASLNDRILPAVMALIIIGAAGYLAYRQAYFAWTVITIYERGLRLDFWRKHLVIPWTKLGKFYLGPGRMPGWHITDRDEHILCELRASAVGRAFDTVAGVAADEAAPSIIDAIVEEAGLAERDTPFRHYAPAPRGSRREKKKRA